MRTKYSKTTRANTHHTPALTSQDRLDIRGNAITFDTRRQTYGFRAKCRDIRNANLTLLNLDSTRI